MSATHQLDKTGHDGMPAMLNQDFETQLKSNWGHIWDCSSFGGKESQGFEHLANVTTQDDVTIFVCWYSVDFVSRIWGQASFQLGRNLFYDTLFEYFVNCTFYTNKTSWTDDTDI